MLGFLFDLADDGLIGQTQYIDPQNACLSAAGQYQSDDKPNEPFPGAGKLVALLPIHSEAHSGKLYCQQVAVEVPHPCQIILCRHFCSSGGIPL